MPPSWPSIFATTRSRSRLRRSTSCSTRSGLASSVTLVSKDDARKEFARDFPDLASATASLDRNPFPASFAVRLNTDAQSAPSAVENLTTTLSAAAGVADVRYDRTWIARLNTTIRVIRGVGLAIILLLAIASALTVANVVRLTAMARRNEIEIMQLVGAPFAYIRGPFIAEGLIQGGVGALAAIVFLLATFAAIRGPLRHADGGCRRPHRCRLRPDRDPAPAGGGRDGARLHRRIRRGADGPLSCTSR